MSNWNINLSKADDCCEQITSGGKNEAYYIGYERGKKAAKSQGYFSQKFTDGELWNVTFFPEPLYISYSFFWGFFEDGIKALASWRKKNNAKTRYGKTEFINEFNSRFNFIFENKLLNEQVKGYVDSLYDDVYTFCIKG